MEAERAAIAHEVHDALLPLIFGANAGVERLKSLSPEELQTSASRELFEQVTKWLADAQVIGRDILAEAYPSQLAHSSWVSAAKQTITRYLLHHPIGAVPFAISNLRWNVDAETCDVSDSVSVTCYRIVVEAIRNSLRHAKAKSIVVFAEKRDQELVVQVEDDGCGFDQQSVSEDRYGIRSMQGRAALVGGKVHIDSKVGGPTKVTLRIPLVSCGK